MKIVAYNVLRSSGTLYRLKDVHTGIEYPNLLTAEQIRSEVVVEAARTYIAMRHIEQTRAQLAAVSPLAGSLFDLLKWAGAGCRDSTPASEPVAESAVTVGERRLLLDKIEQLQRANAGLQERNDRQTRIIQAVQGAVRGDVQ
ncbi:hypothetical protein [Aeromonas phage phiA014L]|uniref:Uncharacterized protein n=1 Tax=Aeromonas phage phiA014L TaxID=3119844 RepID=A0ABZ2CMU8_9CAUD